MNSSQLINQNSSDVEYYTDPKIIAAASQAMGGIDLDPASCEVANARVKALRWFGIEANGIEREWDAFSLWLNHPFGRREPACSPRCEKRIGNPKHVCHAYPLYGNAVWIQKLVGEHGFGRTKQACSITFAATSEAWFQPLMNFPQCYLSPRTNYYLPDGTLKKGVTKGSVVTYMGPRWREFAGAFRGMGKIMFPERQIEL